MFINELPGSALGSSGDLFCRVFVVRVTTICEVSTLTSPSTFFCCLFTLDLNRSAIDPGLGVDAEGDLLLETDDDSLEDEAELSSGLVSGSAVPSGSEQVKFR